jgi:serine/threonine protein kinase
MAQEPSSRQYSAFVIPESNISHPTPHTEQYAPTSLLSLTKFRSLRESNHYKLFWPNDSTEVQPRRRSLTDDQCYHLLRQRWKRLEINPNSSDRLTSLHYVELKAHDSSQDQPPGSTSANDFVAVKEIVVKSLGDKTLENEFRHLSKIRHCHIIASLDILHVKRDSTRSGSTEYRCMILLYPLAVRNLAELFEWLQNKPSSQRSESSDQLINFLPCLCQAVLYLHNFREPGNDKTCSPIRHRDIKPENILVDVFKEVLLADFDISKQYDNKLAVTAGATDKTDRYAAPALLVEGQTAPRGLESDVISLGFVTVVLGASREEMLISFPTKSGEEHSDPGRFCHSKALELKFTWKWIQKLLARIWTGRVPEKLQDGPALRMIEQVILMMNADPGAKGVLEEAYDCFSDIAEKCKHCFSPRRSHEFGNCLSAGRSRSMLNLGTSAKHTRYLPLPHIPMPRTQFDSLLDTSAAPTMQGPLRRFLSDSQLGRAATRDLLSPRDHEKSPRLVDSVDFGDYSRSNGVCVEHIVCPNYDTLVVLRKLTSKFIGTLRYFAESHVAFTSKR